MTATQPRPGTIVTSRSAPSPRTVPTDTGTWFVAGTSDKGPLAPVLCTSLQDFITNFGTRQTYSILYDAVETFFREGGARCYVSRVVGPAPVIASLNLDGSSAGAPYSLVVSAKGPGTYGNSLRVTVTGGGTTNPYTISVNTVADGTLETSPSLADQNAAVAWAQTSAYVNITLGAEASNPVAVSNASLTSGTDDRANATDATWLAALTRFTKDLGPGQVSQPGRTTAQAYTDTQAHAAANNRVALLDGVDTVTAATLKAAAVAQRAANARYGMYLAPWLVVPGVLPGTSRIVPPSAAAAALMGRNDGAGASPNAPAAGVNGILKWVTGLSQSQWDDVTRDDLYTSSVNTFVSRYGSFELYGYRSLVDPIGVDQDWVNFGNCRLNMAIVAKGNVIAEQYVLSEIDSFGRLFKAFQGDLIGMLSKYFQQGSLYGATPEQAFQVDVGPSVNTVTSIANRELHAAISARMSPDAELVVIEIAKVPVTVSL